MSKEEALAIVRQVASEFVGNLKDHEKIQEAIKLIENELKDKVPTKSDKG